MVLSVTPLSLTRFTPGGTTDIINGAVTLTLKAFSGEPCNIVQTDAMLLTINPVPLVNAGVDQTVCCGNNVQLNATAHNYTSVWWYTANGMGYFENENQLNTIYHPYSWECYMGATDLDIWVSPISPCSVGASDFLYVYWEEAPEIYAGPDQLAIEGISAILQGNEPPEGGTGTWSVTSGIGGVVAEPNNPSSVFAGLVENTYTLAWTITTQGGCAVSDNVQIGFICNIQPAVANAGPDQLDLPGTNTILQGNSASTGGYGVWSIVSGMGGEIAEPNNPESGFTGLPGRTYVLKWTIYNLCVTSNDDVTIHFAYESCGIVTDSLTGQVYQTVQIGTQCWMRQNLNFGNQINHTTPQTDNGTIEKYCYDDLPENCLQYGGLYQWDELMAYDSVEYTQGICPEGWHLPNDAEWQTLFDLYGGAGSAGNELVVEGFSGFDALMNGQFNASTGFSGLNNQSTFWSASGIPGGQATAYDLATGSPVVNTGTTGVANGFGVRCLKGYPNRVDPSVKVIDTTVYRLISDSLEMVQGIYRYEVIGSRKAKDLIIADNIVIGTVNEGYLRKVDEAVIIGNEMTLTTSDATLEDVFISGEFGFSSGISGKGELLAFTRVVYLAPGVEIIPSEDGFTYSFSDVVLYQGGNASVTIPQGSISFNPVLNFDFKFKKKHVDLLYFSTENTTLTRSLDITLSAYGQLSVEKEKTFATIKRFVFYMAGVVPVMAVIKTDLKGKLNVTASGDISATVGYTNINGLSFGVKYENDQWQHIWDINSTKYMHPVTWNGHIAFEEQLVITPEINVKFYGVNGCYFNLPLWGELSAHLAFPAMDYDAGLDIGVNGNLGAIVEIFGDTLFDYNKQLFGFSKNIYSAPANLELVSGNGQTGQPNSQLPEPLKVKVTDNLGKTNFPARVHFTVETGGGTLSETDVWTDIDGYAETLWTLGGELGVQTVKVKVLKASGDNITGSPLEFKTFDCGLPFTDSRDGKSYNTVKIGDQCWMAENLNYATGNSWCYENNSGNCSTYGRLYDWQSAMTACPSDWHLPSDSEWTILTDYLGGSGVAGGKMKEAGTAHWYPPNTGATNSSGFTALPGGSRNIDGSFGLLSYYGYWWSSSENDASYAWGRYLGYYYAHVYRNSYLKSNGFSVRCLKDN